MGYSFGQTSLTRLIGVNARLVAVAKRAIAASAQDFCVMEGVRSIEQQRINVARGVSKTMASKHLMQPDGTGHALDLVPWFNGMPRWEWPLIYPIALAMQKAAQDENVTLRWGGVWDSKLNDLPVSAGALRVSVADYCKRHPGPDFLDGPHYELSQ